MANPKFNMFDKHRSVDDPDTMTVSGLNMRDWGQRATYSTR